MRVLYGHLQLLIFNSILTESEASTVVDWVHDDRGLPKYGLPNGRWSWIYVGPLLYRVCSVERPTISVESIDEVQHTPSRYRIRVGMPTSPTSPQARPFGSRQLYTNYQVRSWMVLTPSWRMLLPSCGYLLTFRLKHFDVFDDIPDDLQGKYDIVHARLLLMAVETSDPRPIIRYLVKMLKSGGYLQ